MTRSDEKLCLQWNDFRENVSSAFGKLREDKDFTDVTLVCEDGQQIDTHKVILVASSPFFLNILKRSKHPHPLIYMRCVKSADLLAMVDFLYTGESNVNQENLDSFLQLAEELQLKGLTRQEESRIIPRQTEKPEPTKPTNNVIKNTYPESNLSSTDSTPNEERAIALTGQATKLQRLDKEVKSMMMVSENVVPGKLHGRARICRVCGKEGRMNLIMAHIEAKHMTDLSSACNICGKNFKNRNSLTVHRSREHKKKLNYDNVQEHLET